MLSFYYWVPMNKIIEFNGEKHTIKEWSEKIGVSQNVISTRLRRGWSIARTLSLPNQKNKPIEYNGEKHTLKEWAEIVGIHHRTLYWRLINDWTIADAFTIPSQKDKTQEHVSRLNKPKKISKKECKEDCFNCPFDDCIKGDCND